MLSSAVFLPRVSGRAAKRALKRLRLLVAGRNWAALNSSGSQLIGVRYVQVGLEERENLTVTWNVSIAIRSLCVTLLAAILALVLVVTLAEDADARKVRRKKGVADFAQFSTLQDRYTFLPSSATPTSDLRRRIASLAARERPFLIPTRADWDPPNIQPPKPIDGYICTAEGSVKMVSIDAGPPVTQAAIFDLNDVLDRDAPTTERAEEYTLPPGQLASPDLFKCHLVPNAARPTGTTNDFSCEFAENQQTCVFTMHELVATNIDEVDDDNGHSDRKISTAGTAVRIRSTRLTTCSSPSRATRCPSRCLQVRMLPAKVRRPGSSVWCWPLVGRWWEAW